MNWRQMADGIGGRYVDPQDIHNRFGSSVLAAGYITGSFAWTQAQWNLFPAANRVTIVTYLTDAGDVADCETGDLTPAQAAEWVGMRKVNGYHRPTIYCNASTIPAVRNATGKWVLGRDYDIWVADWTNFPHAVSLCAATQYQSLSDMDLSAVYDFSWPHRTTVVTPPPPPSNNWLKKAVDKLPTLKEGTVDHLGHVYHVHKLQGLLVGSGFHVAVDGDFGPATRTAVLEAQKKFGLSRDGIVGPDTWTALLTR